MAWTTAFAYAGSVTTRVFSQMGLRSVDERTAGEDARTGHLAVADHFAQRQDAFAVDVARVAHRRHAMHQKEKRKEIARDRYGLRRMMGVHIDEAGQHVHAGVGAAVTLLGAMAPMVEPEIASV